MRTMTPQTLFRLTGIVFGERRNLCKTIRMEKGVDYIGVAVCFYCHDSDGNYVLTKRSASCRDEQGRWDFGGGGVRFGETVIQTLLREIKEEYGTEPVSYEFLECDEVFREHDGKRTHWIDFRYKVLLNRALVTNNEPEKHDDIGWFTLDDLPSPLHSQIEREVEKYKGLL